VVAKPFISISLPSIYADCLGRTLRNVRDATRSRYEVILVSPTAPPEDCAEHVTWIEEKPGTGTGCNAGHAAALEHMRGDFFMPWVDDHYLLDGWDALALANYERREAAFHGSAPGKPFALGMRHIFPHHVGTQFGIYYPYFPLIRRKYVEQVGWYDPAYLKGFADGDLALRVWSAGGRCEWSDHGLVHVHLEDDNRKDGVMFAPSDMDLFVSRWAPRYGAGWDTGNLRGFNIDVEPNQFPGLCDGSTVYRNDPAFRATLVDGGWRVYA
jgi:hypothetical protein